MNFLSLEYFLKIAELGSISAAARELFISQQSLSEHLHKLEEEVGTSLFYRERPIRLTEAGIRFKEGAEVMVYQHDKMLSDISKIVGKEKNHLTIGISAYQSPPFLSDLIKRFTMHNDKCSISVVKRRPNDIAKNMKGIDIFISYPPFAEELTHEKIVKDEEKCLACRRSLFEATYGNKWPEIEQILIHTKDLRILADLPMIVPNNHIGNIPMYWKDIFTNAGFSPNIAFQSDNGDLNNSMCSNGKGACIHLSSWVRAYFADEAKDIDDPMLFFPIEAGSMSGDMAVSYIKGKKLSSLEKAFIDEMRELLLEERPDSTVV